MLPTEGRDAPHGGTNRFQRWNEKFPALEKKISSVGKEDFLPWKLFFPRKESFWKSYKAFKCFAGNFKKVVKERVD